MTDIFNGVKKPWGKKTVLTVPTSTDTTQLRGFMGLRIITNGFNELLLEVSDKYFNFVAAITYVT